MSIESVLGKIWTDIKSLFKKVLGNAPAAIQDAQIALAGIAPMVELAADEINPAVGTEITNGVNLALSGLSELQTVVATYEKTPTTTNLQAVQSGADAVSANLNGILTTAKVTNTKTVATITTIVNPVDADLKVFISSILAVHPISVVGTTPATPPAA